MPRAVFYAGIVLAVGCASRPNFSSVSTNSVSLRPAVELHDDAAGHQHLASGGHAGSVASDDDFGTARPSSKADDAQAFDVHNASFPSNRAFVDSDTPDLPVSNPHGALLLPNWSHEDTDAAKPDAAAVPLPNYIVEHDAPTADTDSKTTNDPSARPQKSPFMLLRLTTPKYPPLRQ